MVLRLVLVGMVPYPDCLDRLRMKLHEKYKGSITDGLGGGMLGGMAGRQVYVLKKSAAAELFPEFESEEWFEALVERMWEDGFVAKDDGHELVFPWAFASSRFRELERTRWFRQ